MKKYVLNKNQEKQILLKDYGKYVVELVGEGARATILGAFHLKGGGNEKVYLEVIHKDKHTSADTIIRAVVEGNSQIDIRGKIIVEEEASNTESFLQERVLLVSETSKALAIPDLEIKNNEVKCSHAAAVGNMGEDEIFYLMSRGIKKSVAEKMIVEGFLQPVWDKIGGKI